MMLTQQPILFHVHLLFTHNLLKSAMLDKKINYSAQLIMGYKNNLRSA